VIFSLRPSTSSTAVGIESTGARCGQFMHFIGQTPGVLEVNGIPAPDAVDRIKLSP
jgi:hypothetical protein